MSYKFLRHRWNGLLKIWNRNIYIYRKPDWHGNLCSKHSFLRYYVIYTSLDQKCAEYVSNQMSLRGIDSDQVSPHRFSTIHGFQIWYSNIGYYLTQISNIIIYYTSLFTEIVIAHQWSVDLSALGYIIILPNSKCIDYRICDFFPTRVHWTFLHYSDTL